MTDHKPLRLNDNFPTRIGLGGEGVLRTMGRDREATSVITTALESGIIYFDSAPAYADCQRYLGSVWRAEPEDRKRIFQAGKSAKRTSAEAMADLDRSLSLLGSDYLDLWQIHDVRTREDLEAIAGPGGALEAFIKAREQGKVRYIGVTGHHDPAVLTSAVREWPVDAVLLPVNPVEKLIGGFLDKTLPTAREKGIAVIAMKVLGGGHYVAPGAGVSPQALIRFALAQPVDHVIVGCRTPGEVKELAGCGETPTMTEKEQEELVDLFRPHSTRLAFYRGAL